jgi:3-oxoacyl-[acyl-carrier protein] reductase
MAHRGLSGKVVIVTGAAAGIGRVTAKRFAEEECRVAAWDLNDADRIQICQEIRAGENRGLFHKTDVANSADVESAVSEVLGRWGRIDVLVNNAGIVRDEQLVKWKDSQVVGIMSDGTFNDVIAVDLKGVFHCARAVVPHMIRSGGGVILNASSIVGLYGNFGQTNYAAAKAGVIGFTRTWCRELGKHNIRVNAVAPGSISTEMVRSVPDKVIQNIASHTPLYQVPENARKLPLVFWHGHGQSAKNSETTPDGHEGLQNIFLRRRFPVYLIDQPRRGRATRGTQPINITATADVCPFPARLQFIDPRRAEATLQAPQGKSTMSELEIQIANSGQ